jgi:glycosyltransferase involved in cell wall biosynthesis
MKILFVGQNFRIVGGSDRIFFDEMSLLQDFGHEVVPFCAKHPDNLKTEWASYFPEAPSFDNPRIMDAANYVYSRKAKHQIARILDDFAPDIVHCHIYYGKLTPSILSPIKRRGIPLVQTLHEYKTVCPVYTLQSNGTPCCDCSGFRFYNVIKNCCKRGSFIRSFLTCVEAYVSLICGSIYNFDHFIAVSNFLRQTVINMGVSENKITTIYNFTDASLFEPMYKPGDYFVFFGRLEKNKGVWPLIETFRRLPHLRLLIAGSGAEEGLMKLYLNNNGIRNIEMLGHKSRKGLSDIIRNSLCIIVPSTCNETFGLTITEAFAYGKPVIASKIGGIPEVISDGEDGILLEPGNVEDLVQAVASMSSNRSRCEIMGRAGRKNLIHKFSRESHYQKLMQVYAKVLEKWR